MIHKGRGVTIRVLECSARIWDALGGYRGRNRPCAVHAQRSCPPAPGDSTDLRQRLPAGAKIAMKLSATSKMATLAQVPAVLRLEMQEVRDAAPIYVEATNLVTGPTETEGNWQADILQPENGNMPFHSIYFCTAYAGAGFPF